MRNILFPLLFGLLTFGFVSNATAQEIVDDHEISEALNDVFGKIFKNEISFNQSLKYAQVYFDQNSSGYINHVYRLLGKTSGTVTKQQMNAAILVVAREFVIDFKKLPKRYFDNIDRLDSLFAIKTPKDKNDDGFTPKSPGQPCNNVDFETGNFTGWELYKGTRTTGNFTTSAMSTVAAGDQHLIVTAGTDAITGLSRIPPGGGTYAARLGDLTTVNSGNGTAASMRQTFLVDANSTSFVFKYAVVLEEGSHTTNDQAFFKVNLYDKNNNPLPCGSFAQTATDAKTSPLFSTKTTGGKTYYYSNWITAVIPLSPYIGENITIEFIATDCQPRGHLGYAYIDASCSPLEVTTTKHFICEGQETATLTAPPGAKSYLWSPGNQTSQTITVSQAGNYTVKVTPDVLTGAAACAVDLPIFVDGSKVTADFTADPLVLCAKESIDVTESSSITCFTPGNDNIVDWKWDFNGDNTTDFTGQNPPSPAYTFNTQGTYNAKLTVTTTRNCVSTKVVPIVVNPLPTATISGTTDVCQNGVAPNITFTGANGTAPYTFTYTINGGSNQTVTSTGNIATVSVPTGTDGTFTYTLVSVQDASSTTCSNPQTGTATVKVNPLPTAIISGTTDVCQNGAAPNITFTGANGTAPYTFTYTINGGSNQTVISTGNTATVSVPTGTAGTFTYTLVSVRDASSTTCSNPQTGTATVKVNPLPTAIISGTTDVCQNGAAPNIIFTGANGIAPYTFTYTINGGSNQTVTSTGNTATVSVPTGTDGTFTYTLVSVQDASSTTCSNPQSGTATVVVNPLPTATISGTTDVCQNGVSPNITFTGANGTAPYTFTYTINGGSNQTVISTGNTATVSVPTGTDGTFTYTLVSVQDASSTTCSNPQTGTATVKVNPLPTAIISGTTDVCQNGAAPNITFTGANGTAPYTFTYTINGGSNQTVTSTGNTATVSVPTGTDGTFTYTLVSVRDASSTTCSNPQSGTATVVVNPLPTATISGTTDVCRDNTSPDITFTGANGTAPYTFTYTINGGSNQTIISTGNTATISVPTGTDGTFTYTLVSVRDASSTTCFNPQSGTATVVVNPLPTATVTSSNIVHNCLVGGTTGSATISASGGTPSYLYSLDGGVTNQPSDIFSNLASGTYTVTISDINNCTAITTFTINDPANNEELDVVAVPGNLTHNCFVNGTDGSATLTATGGYAPYTYQVTGPNSYNTTQVANPTFTNLLSGTYNVTVSDTNGCSATTTFQINDPANNEELAVVALPDNLIHNCFVNGTDGSATLTATGGYAPYTYQVTGPNSYNTTQVSNPTFTNLLSGTYNVTVSDTNGCSATTTFTIVDPANGAVLTATVPSDSLTHNCIVGANTGIVHVAATGGFAPYMYQLASGTPQASNTFTGLAAGNYSVTVTDTNGCTSMVAFTILEPTDNLTLTVQTGSVIHNCVPNASTGSAVLVAAGGYGSYSYVLDAGTAQPQGSFTNLTTGNHTVVVTDLHGCTATQTFYISNPPSQQELTATVNPSDVLHNCIPGGQAGQAAISALYGFPPYTYTLNGGTPQVSSVFTSLASGNYTVIVTDSNGCQKTATFTINDPLNGQELAVNIAPQNIVHICVPGTNTGSVTVTAANGFPSYVYSLNGGANQTSNVFNNLAAGNYTVTVTDQNGCLKTASFIIEQPAIELAAQIFSNNVTHVCVPGQNTGSFEVSAYGGFAPLTYSFNGGAFTSNNIYTNLFAGTYTVTVKDAHNCTKDVTVTITNPPSGHAISAFVNELDINHNCIAGQNNGVVKISASGGYTPYRYVVAGGTPQISNIFTGVATGTHNFTVIDANGCETYVSATVKDNDLPQIYLANADSNGCAPLTLTFDKNEYNYLSCNWLINGDTVNKNCNDMEYTFNTPGCYQVQFVGQGQTRCYGSSNMVTICVTSRPIASFTPSSYEVNSIENVIYFNNTSQNADYYNWSFGDFTPDATTEHVTHTFVGVENQNFTVILTAYTETGCADTAAVRFTMKEEIIFFVPNAFTPDGDNFNNVFKPIITEGVDLTSYNLLIFDRWGEVIFESNDVDYGWDGTYLFNGGKLCQDGTYVWKIRFKKKGMDDIIEKTGHVTLVR